MQKENRAAMCSGLLLAVYIAKFFTGICTTTRLNGHERTYINIYIFESFTIDCFCTVNEH